MTGLSEERLGPLRVAKLRALAADRLSGDEVESGPFGRGAALLERSGLAAVLIEEANLRSLGGALTWAARHGAAELLAIVECEADVAGHLAREAGWFSRPIEVRRVVDRSTEAVAPTPFGEPGPQTAGAETDPSGLAACTRLLADAGCEVVVEHGVVKGEILGLEVARVVTAEGVAALEVGVGKFDREISAMMNANLAPQETLRAAIDMVRTYRHVGAQVHPLRDLVGERWLRCIVLAEPELVGATALRPVDTTVEPTSLRESQPAAAVGTLVAGGSVVVVCTAGVDLDLIALAEDTRRSVDPDAELVVCGPGRNFLGPIRVVGALLERPPRFVAVDLPF